jgi:hypothetical protein
MMLLMCPLLPPLKRLLQQPSPDTTRPCPVLPRSVAINVGPSMGAALAPLTDAIAALGTVGVCAAYTLLILPDSLSEEAKAAVGQPVGGRYASCWLHLLLAACLCWLAACLCWLAA